VTSTRASVSTGTVKQSLTNSEFLLKSGASAEPFTFTLTVPTGMTSKQSNLTQIQRSLLLGSILGDARLLRTGSKTAALSEYHCTKQSEYLQWKVDIWGPDYICSVRPQSVTRRGKTYTGSILRTYGTHLLFPWWQELYEGGIGDKVFTHIDLQNFDAFSLAVWYMDDGGKTKNGYVRFSVTPHELSQEVQLSLLRGFGLTPKLHGSGSDSTIWIHDQLSMTRFLDLVTPHIPPCMQHKLDLRPRKRGPAARNVLTSDTLREYLNEGKSVAEIATLTSTSLTSVRRHLKCHSLSVR